MNKKSLILIGLFFLKSNNCLYGIELQWVKSPEGPLTIEFIRDLKQWFNADNFIETGTWTGGTTAQASVVFDSVYTVELGEKAYQSACDRFKNTENICLYQGDSGSVLTKILPNVSGKAIFWLDAHWSGGETAHGSCYSPIIEELQAIKKNNIIDAVILIDDQRVFYELSWPELSQAIKALVDINPRYRIIAYGDTLMAYQNTEKITISPCIEACTISRFFDTHCFNYTLDELFTAERVIACTQGNELVALDQYCSLFERTDDHHGLLWKALIFEQNEKYIEACVVLKRIVDSPKQRTINHWRVNWYLARTAFKAGKKKIAQEALQKVIAQQPDFMPAQELFRKLNGK